MTIKKTLCLLLSVVLVFSLLCSCGSSKAENDSAFSDQLTGDMIPGGNGDAVNEEYLALIGDDIETTVKIQAEQNRKLIRTVDIEAETKQFSKVVASIEAAVNNSGGYIQQQALRTNYSNNRYSTMVLRIPADKLDEFLSKLNEEVNVVSQSSNVNDVTDEYVDIESRIAALETEQEALMTMLEKAEKLDDIIAIQSRLSEVRGSLESYKARQKGYDTLINYSTVNLDLNEVERETEKEPSFWSRLGSAFVDGWDIFVVTLGEILIAVIGGLPFIVIIGGIVTAIVILSKKSCKKKKAAKKQELDNEEN